MCRPPHSVCDADFILTTFLFHILFCLSSCLSFWGEGGGQAKPLTGLPPPLPLVWASPSTPMLDPDNFCPSHSFLSWGGGSCVGVGVEREWWRQRSGKLYPFTIKIENSREMEIRGKKRRWWRKTENHFLIITSTDNCQCYLHLEIKSNNNVKMNCTAPAPFPHACAHTHTTPRIKTWTKQSTTKSNKNRTDRLKTQKHNLTQAKNNKTKKHKHQKTPLF